MIAADMIAVVDLLQSTGVWAIFLWLYISEKRNHELTRIAYRNDLREIAVMRNESPQ